MSNTFFQRRQKCSQRRLSPCAPLVTGLIIGNDFFVFHKIALPQLFFCHPCPTDVPASLAIRERPVQRYCEVFKLGVTPRYLSCSVLKETYFPMLIRQASPGYSGLLLQRILCIFSDYRCTVMVLVLVEKGEPSHDVIILSQPW